MTTRPASTPGIRGVRKAVPARGTATALLLTSALALTACSGSGSDEGKDSKDVTLVTHGSFAVSKDVLAAFEKRSGYKVTVLKSGDAGEAVNKALLTKDNPQGDVFFGVDNTLASRALDGGLFDRYRAKDADALRQDTFLEGAGDRLTPVDTGDICVNYDKAYFEKKKLAPPKNLDDLTKPAYKNLLVTENASTSSPGLGFLLASVGAQGENGWQSYWKKLKANGVKVVNGWEQAYNEEFSGSSTGRKAGGDRPLVVSYASSPPAEVYYADPAPKSAPTGVADGTCFRQVEYAGLLSNAANPEGGKALIDFLTSKAFQEDMPLNMFVAPVREDAKVPEVFRKYGAEAENPHTVAPATIAEHRDDWVKQWTSLVLK